MARFSTKGLEPVLEDMRRLDQLFGPTADRMLIAGAQAVQHAWRQEAERRRFRDTGAMIRAVGFPNKVTRASDIRSIDIYPQGKDKTGKRHAEKAFILHYGVKGGKSQKRRKDKKFPGPGIPRTFWVDDADKAAEPLVLEAYTKIWDEFLKGR